MDHKTILFDLDGTLTDSADGIINCTILALNHFGLPIPSRDTLKAVVGPPLRDSFLRFGVQENQIDEAFRVFRSRYSTVGKYENAPYPGIASMLSKLHNAGHLLYIATSKPEEMAVDILNKFQLSCYFKQICGATMDESRVTKDEVISYLMEHNGQLDQPVMVGDTAFDVLGAAAHGIPTIGVRWGYGKVSEMEQAGAVAIAENPEQLFDLLQK